MFLSVLSFRHAIACHYIRDLVAQHTEKFKRQPVVDSISVMHVFRRRRRSRSEWSFESETPSRR